MYIPKAFEETRIDVLQRFAHERGFASLVVRCRSGLEVAPIPLLVDRDVPPFGALRGHVARANPIWREAEPNAEAVAIFSGPDSYISPSWYPSKQAAGGRVVPTWNYVTVHAHGTLRFIDDPIWLRSHVEALTDRHEAARAERWRLSDAPESFIAKMLTAIVGVELVVTRFYGKWKLGQNRSAEDRDGLKRGLYEEGTPHSSALAALLDPPPP